MAAQNASELNPIATAEPAEGTLPLLARVSAASEQSGQPGALRFALEVVNVSTEPVTLHNPYDGVTYTLTDGEGWPVGQRAPGRAGKVNGPARARATKAPYLAARSIARDDVELEVADAIEADAVELPPASTYRLVLEITARAPASGEGDPAPLGPDAYRIVVLLPLSWTVRGRHHDVTMRSDEISVTLTS